MNPHDLVNPFKYLASEAGKVIADGWTSAMLGLWGSCSIKVMRTSSVAAPAVRRSMRSTRKAALQRSPGLHLLLAAMLQRP